MTRTHSPPSPTILERRLKALLFASLVVLPIAWAIQSSQAQSASTLGAPSMPVSNLISGEHGTPGDLLDDCFYFNLHDQDTAAAPRAMDVRLVPCQTYPGLSYVYVTHSDFGMGSLVPPPVQLVFVDEDGDAIADASEAFYLTSGATDSIQPSSPSVVTIRLIGASPYAPGTVVRSGHADAFDPSSAVSGSIAWLDEDQSGSLTMYDSVWLLVGTPAGYSGSQLPSNAVQLLGGSAASTTTSGPAPTGLVLADASRPVGPILRVDSGDGACFYLEMPQGGREPVQVLALDVRLNTCLGYGGPSYVRSHESDLGTAATWTPPLALYWWDANGDADLDQGEPLYLKSDEGDTLEPGQIAIRLTDAFGKSRGTLVQPQDVDAGRMLSFTDGSFAWVDEDQDGTRSIADSVWVLPLDSSGRAPGTALPPSAILLAKGAYTTPTPPPSPPTTRAPTPSPTTTAHEPPRGDVHLEPRSVAFSVESASPRENVTIYAVVKNPTTRPVAVEVVLQAYRPDAALQTERRIPITVAAGGEYVLEQPWAPLVAGRHFVSVWIEPGDTQLAGAEQVPFSFGKELGDTGFLDVGGIPSDSRLLAMRADERHLGSVAAGQARLFSVRLTAHNHDTHIVQFDGLKEDGVTVRALSAGDIEDGQTVEYVLEVQTDRRSRGGAGGFLLRAQSEEANSQVLAFTLDIQANDEDEPPRVIPALGAGGAAAGAAAAGGVAAFFRARRRD